MHYMAQPLSFRWDEDFIARIDRARGLVPRSAFVREAVEQVLADDTQTGAQPSREGVDGHFTRDHPSPTGAASDRGASEPPSPAERPVRSSAQSKAGIGPIPKPGGKR